MKTFKIIAEITIELDAFERSDAIDAVSDGVVDCIPGANVSYDIRMVKEL